MNEQVSLTRLIAMIAMTAGDRWLRPCAVSWSSLPRSSTRVVAVFVLISVVGGCSSSKSHPTATVPLDPEGSAVMYQQYLVQSGEAFVLTDNPLAFLQWVTPTEISISFRGIVAATQTADEYPTIDGARRISIGTTGLLRTNDLPPSAAVFVMNREGYAFVDTEDLRGGGNINLQAWGQIQGNLPIRKNSVNEGDSVNASGELTTHRGRSLPWFKAVELDRNGDFSFRQVPTGQALLGHITLIKETDHVMRSTRDHVTPCNIISGAVISITLDESGKDG